MAFKSYIADKDILYKHISECIRKSRTYKLSYLEDYYSRQDIINDCWIFCLESDRTCVQEVTTWYNNRAITCNDSNRRLRQRVKIAVKEYVLSQYNKHIRKERIMRESMLENISSNNTELSIDLFSDMKLISDMKLSKKESLLVYWKMDLLEEEEVMLALGCCQKTLYNRWMKLKSKIKEAYNK